MQELHRSSSPAPARLWLWFRMSKDARSPAEKEFLGLPGPAIASLRERMTRAAAGESRAKDVDHLGDGIYEIRTRLQNNPYRVLFFHWGPHFVALTAFYKNQRKTPQADIDLAKQRRTAWRQAFGDDQSGG